MSALEKMQLSSKVFRITSYYYHSYFFVQGNSFCLITCCGFLFFYWFGKFLFLTFVLETHVMCIYGYCIRKTIFIPLFFLSYTLSFKNSYRLLLLRLRSSEDSVSIFLLCILVGNCKKDCWITLVVFHKPSLYSGKLVAKCIAMLG